ncbi:unnamed protein product [Ilex paraguariensis]|uniref:Fatty acyl-CoA reductase n=1 Tax=Ilex paraguariensis TaxID=185542 RepID=A0ABC8S149_9AQUA
MELGSIVQFLENKTIFVTGSTGFLGKVFVEKIVRVQPNVKKLYFLLRAADTKSALKRFNSEVVAKDLFRVLKERWGGNLYTLLSQKATLVPGDITCNNLGVKDSDLLEEMWREVDVVVNLAATTNFDERSYVSGEKAGLILENPYNMGETLNGTPGLDINVEKKMMEERLNELRVEKSSEQEITSAMKDIGIKRARKYGWPNTYVFTKAMGEMLLGNYKGNIPFVIIRPTIITSTYKEPFPGWVEGIRTIDSLGVGYGKGKITCFLGDPNTVIDVIPVDMVVNAMIVAMAAHATNQPAMNIYQVGSSVANPLVFTYLQDYGFRYFTKNPWINKKGKPVIVGKVKVLSTMDSFHRYMTIRYLLPLKVLQIINTALCQYFQDMYLDLRRKINFVYRLIELYEPYLFFKGVFDDMNTERLRRATTKGDVETDVFYFDPRCINWEDYFMNTHIHGVVKYVFNDDKKG